MIRASVLTVIAAGLLAGGLADSATASTLLTPRNEVRTVYPGDSWTPPPRARTLELISRVTATRRYADVGVRARLKGRAERRAVRQATFLVGLEGDRAGIFADYGAPSYRLYHDYAGRERETWTYPSHQFTAVFEGSRLVDINHW